MALPGEQTKAAGDVKRAIHGRGRKTCVDCTQKLPRTQFMASNKSADGLQTRCRDCSREHTRRRAMERKGIAYVRCEPHQKQCPTCGEVKDRADGFSKNGGTYDGLQSSCKVCTRAATRRSELKHGGKSVGKGVRIKPAAARKNGTRKPRKNGTRNAQLEQVVSGASHGDIVVQIATAMGRAGVSSVALDPRTGDVEATVIIKAHIDLGGKQ